MFYICCYLLCCTLTCSKISVSAWLTGNHSTLYTVRLSSPSVNSVFGVWWLRVEKNIDKRRKGREREKHSHPEGQGGVQREG